LCWPSTIDSCHWNWYWPPMPKTAPGFLTVLLTQLQDFLLSSWHGSRFSYRPPDTAPVFLTLLLTQLQALLLAS
jgi:hypothetical protein